MEVVLRSRVRAEDVIGYIGSVSLTCSIYNTADFYLGVLNEIKKQDVDLWKAIASSVRLESIYGDDKPRNLVRLLRLIAQSGDDAALRILHEGAHGRGNATPTQIAQSIASAIYLMQAAEAIEFLESVIKSQDLRDDDIVGSELIQQLVTTKLMSEDQGVGAIHLIEKTLYDSRLEYSAAVTIVERYSKTVPGPIDPEVWSHVVARAAEITGN